MQLSKLKMRRYSSGLNHSSHNQKLMRKSLSRIFRLGSWRRRWRVGGVVRDNEKGCCKARL